MRYGALLRHRDGRAMEFDSGWTEATYEQDFAFLPIHLHIAIGLLCAGGTRGWIDALRKEASSNQPRKKIFLGPFNRRSV